MVFPSTPTQWEQIAFAKLSKVLGVDEATTVMTRTLEDMKLGELITPDDLYAFAACLSKQSGFAGTVGALLQLHAVVKGARGAGG